VNNKTARCDHKRITRKKNPTNKRNRAVFHPVRRQNDYQGYRGTHDQAGSAGAAPILIGAAMIAAALLLSTLITTLGGRYVGIEGPTDDSAWLVDRLTGNVYKCQAASRGKAACEPEIATGSVSGRPK
jgi:hypothetical protein